MSDTIPPAPLSEFAMIATLFAPMADHPGALGLRDDAALLPQTAGLETVLTMDALVAGVHFFPDDPPDTIAAKALGVNASDLAAKGADPTGFLLALTLPRHHDTQWIATFAAGLATAARDFGLSLLGGDTTTTPGPLTIAITALGTVPVGRMIRRAGARPGDGVYVSGTIGDAGCGLDRLTQRPSGRRPSSAVPAEPLRAAQSAQATDTTSGTIGDAGCGLDLLTRGTPASNLDVEAFLVARYRTPTPRLRLGRLLRGVATAGLDVSDGLIADLGHICETSRVALRIDAGCIPLSAALRQVWGEDIQSIVRAVTAGDDYELAFTAADEGTVMDAARLADTPVTRIGTVVAGTGVKLFAEGVEIPVLRPGYTHF